MAGQVFAGTSGWAYPSWKPGFYPKDVPARRFLEHYGSRLNSVEVNYTFRTLPTAEQLEGWLAATPEDFRFSFKAPEGVTHRKRLRGCEEAVEAFVAALEPVRAAGRLGCCCSSCRRTSRRTLHGWRLLLPAALPGGRACAFEFRHESWFAEETYAVLRGCGAGFALRRATS